MESHLPQVESDTVSLTSQMDTHLIDLENQRVDLVHQLILEFAQHKAMMNEVVGGAKGHFRGSAEA